MLPTFMDKIPADALDAARAAWRATWPMFELQGHRRFSIVQSIGHATIPAEDPTAPGERGVHWLLLDHKKCLHVATTRGAATCLGSAFKAAEAARLVTSFNMKPQVSLTTSATPTRLPAADRAALAHAIRCPRAGGENSYLSMVEQVFYMEAMRHIVDRLQPEALEAARGITRKLGKHRLPAIYSYNIFAGGGADEAASSAAEWRQQAAQTYPVFARAIRDIPELVETIDASSPLVASIARIKHLRPATVRALKGRPFGGEVGTVATPTHVGWTIRVADCLPPDWLPRTPERWTELHRFARQLDAMGLFRFARGSVEQARVRHGMAGEAKQPGMEAIHRMLADILRRNGREFDAMTRTEQGRGGAPGVDASLQNAVAHLPDAGFSLCLEVVLPALASRGIETVRSSSLGLHADLRQLGTELIALGRSPRGMLRISRTHLGRHGAMAAVGGRVADRSETWWSPLGDDAVAPNGLAIHNLVTAEALDQEGRAMRHCVGSYAWHCHSGMSRILGLRRVAQDGSHTSSSTAEIRVQRGGRLSVTQHRGVENSHVSHEDQTALLWYLKQLEQGAIPNNLQELEALNTRSSMGDHVLLENQGIERLLDGASGFDWRCPDARLRAWRVWARLLESKAPTPEAWLAGLCPDVLLAAPDAPVRTTVRCLFQSGAQDNAPAPDQAQAAMAG